MSKKKSKAGTYLSMGSTLFSAFGVAKRLRSARSEGDRLELVDAVVSAAGIATSIALLVRELRRMQHEEGDVLAD